MCLLSSEGLQVLARSRAGALLITRSQGSLRKLCVSGVLMNQTFEFIADNAKSLQALHLTRSEIGDPAVERLAEKFSNVTFLDISYCNDMGARALEAIGKQCKKSHFPPPNNAPPRASLKCWTFGGCWGVTIDEKPQEAFGLKVVGPVVFDCYDKYGWENCSDNSGSSGYLPWDLVGGDLDDEYDVSDGLWDDAEDVEDVEMWFYDGLNTINAGYDWPQSP
nr:F-box protein FBW2-like [Ipomoea batatas]